MGGHLQFFAERRLITLAPSRVTALTATERPDDENGCTTFGGCRRPVVTRPIAAPTVAPDLPVRWNFANNRAGCDPAMLAVLGAPRP